MQMNLTNINTSLQSMSNVFVTDRLACKREAIVDHVEAIEPLVVVDIPHFVEGCRRCIRKVMRTPSLPGMSGVTGRLSQTKSCCAFTNRLKVLRQRSSYYQLGME